MEVLRGMGQVVFCHPAAEEVKRSADALSWQTMRRFQECLAESHGRGNSMLSGGFLAARKHGTATSRAGEERGREPCLRAP